MDSIINTTIKNVCTVYGVDIPEGFVGSEPVRFYVADDGCWSVDTTVCDLSDSWAPVDDDVAEELRRSTVIMSDGRCRGFGSDPYKWVSGLTAEERETVRSGGLVVVDSGHPCDGKNGTTLRKVVLRGNRWTRRCLSSEELQLVAEVL